MGQNNQTQKFKWPQTKNPIIFIVRKFGGSTIFILLGTIYLLNRLGIKSNIPFLVIADLFLFSMAYLFMQQELKVYKLLGWVIVFATVLMNLSELFPVIFTIIPWW